MLIKGNVALCADIGGTNANFGIVRYKGKKPEINLIKHICTSSADNFLDLVNGYLDEIKKKLNKIPKVACFAAAGPVKDDKIKMTNTNLVIDKKELKRKTPLKKILLINDFDAIGYAINILKKKDLVILNKGRPVKKGVKALIGAGTGLGKNILVYDEELKIYVPHSSEGGHSDFPILNKEELNLVEFIKKNKKFKRIYYEDLVSGKGLENIYSYLTKIKFKKAVKLKALDISKTRKINPCSKETYKWFVKFYARAARNFSLEVLPFGGLYIGGGIAANNYDAFYKEFMKEFVNHDKFRDLLKDIPVYVIKNYDVSLIGAAFALLNWR
jgi:glucokinase